jgi:hypothetical protein
MLPTWEPMVMGCQRPPIGRGMEATTSLTTAPPTNLKKALEACGPIIDPIGLASVLLVVPIPRYVVGKCCADPNHIENFEKADFEDDLLEAQEQTDSFDMGSCLWAKLRHY